jgi:hypothetical protein
LLALGASYAYAQKGTLRGVVSDSAGAPISNANVGIVALKELTRTDDHGRFAFRKLPPGEVEVSVRRLGYQPHSVYVVVTPASVDSLSVKLVPQPAALEGVAVSAAGFRRRQGIEEFHQRRIRGLGDYITREEILSRGTNKPTDLLRNMAGIRIVNLRGGGTGVRFMSASSMRRDCAPMLWIDGQKAPGMEIDALSASDLEGIELYNGPSTTPMQFAQSASSSTCGTIIVWSRSPGI